MVDVILGLQWGDEGKGKIVDTLSNNYDIVARFQGGPNAGHTLVFDGQKYVLHTVPSGIFRKHITNVIGNGVVIDPITLVKELSMLDEAGFEYRDRLLIAKKAHLILPSHRNIDAASENAKGKMKIGSTLKGIGPTYMDKTGRNGLRIGDIYLPQFEDKYQALKEKHQMFLQQFPEVEFDIKGEEIKWFEAINKLKELTFIDCDYYINAKIKEGKKILAEGAQGMMLDIDFGTYPFVTSSNTITAGVCTGLGIAPQLIGEVFGIAKAYATRVGSGSFPSEQLNKFGNHLGEKGHEFGATTGRKRRCGWLDLVQLNYACMINGVTQIVLTKLDVLDELETIQVGTAYNYDGQSTTEIPFDINLTDIKIDYTPLKGWQSNIEEIEDYGMLPQAAQDYVEFIEKKMGIKISMVSNGPQRKRIFYR